MSTSDIERWFMRKQFGGKVRLRTYRKLAGLLRNNVALPKALEGMHGHESYDGKKKTPSSVAIDAWLSQIKNGKPLGVAVRGWVPDNDRIVLEAGQGNLPEALSNACLLHESQAKIKGALIGGLAYPAMLIVVAIGFLILFGLQVVPQFASVMPRAKWTGVGAQMGQMSDFVRSYLMPTLVVAAVLIAALIWSMPRWTGSLRARVDRYPPFSIYRLVAGSGFLLSMAALMRSGVKTTAALRMLQRDATPWYNERISKTLAYVNNGVSLGDALLKTRLNFPDRETVNDLRTYSDLEGFDEMLMQIGEENLTDTVERIKVQTVVMKNLGIIILGGVFAWIAMGIFSLVSQIQTNL